MVFDDSPEPASASTGRTPDADEDTRVIEQPVAKNPQTALLSHSALLSRRQDNLAPPMQSIPMPSRPTETEMQHLLTQQRTQTESPNADQIIAGEGPLTPRNNAGPFVFDGSGSRTGSRRQLVVPGHTLDEISDGIE